MASRGQMTGMQGVYLVAAEMTSRGFIVSPTSRSAAGADLLVTDQRCQKAWSVQVKTNAKTSRFWLVGEHATQIKSDSHVYVFVDLSKAEELRYIVASSHHVASKVRRKDRSTGSVWWSFYGEDRPEVDGGWELFGDPHTTADPETTDSV